MSYERPIVLSMAGFDPCGGAGVLADIKTFEQHRCLGMAVNTGYTNQVEDRFISVKWAAVDEIITPLTVLMDTYPIAFVKIGIIENLQVLFEIIKALKQKNKAVKIIWDTVLAASAHVTFLETVDEEQLNVILKEIYLITPNTTEAIKLSGYDDEMAAAKALSAYCHVLLKGGHSETEKGNDYLFFNDQRITKIEAGTAHALAPKHGSGCILSSAIAANLALGNELEDSCKKAKQYIETTLNSNSNLLAYHVA
jgi:hydroxymethylpyrimidine/phosphomethylpyrimidine kinase